MISRTLNKVKCFDFLIGVRILAHERPQASYKITTIFILILIIRYLGWKAIRDMNTRGAPAIAITGCLALAVELVNLDFDSTYAFDQFVIEKLGPARNLTQ